MKQIYEECVNYVVKQLLDQYNQCISNFNRSFVHQNDLNDEDLNKYEDCICRAQDAECMRTAHLGNKVPQAAAYVQNLENQVKILLSALKENRIVDPTFKIILEKIKLISSHFKDLKSKYIEAREILKQEIHSVIHSFENNLSSHLFDKCADDLILIHHSFNFEEHLNSEHIKDNYIRLGELFLEELRDLANKQGEIFVKDKLEEADIQNLSKCLNILQSAKNVNKLQPHIPLKDIREVFDSFLAKIIDYFEGINGKINEQFKKERENAFPAIENLVDQMCILRTIPAVDSETSQSYFSTLELLCGFIQEIRRDIENSLQNLTLDKEVNIFARLILFQKCINSEIT